MRFDSLGEEVDELAIMRAWKKACDGEVGIIFRQRKDIGCVGESEQQHHKVSQLHAE